MPDGCSINDLAIYYLFEIKKAEDQFGLGNKNNSEAFSHVATLAELVKYPQIFSFGHFNGFNMFF
jgi:hypothetical protein